MKSKNQISNKEMHKFLSRESKKLIPEFYDAYYQVEQEIEGAKFFVKQAFKMPCNHKRRCYRLWKRTGSIEAINAYFKDRGMEIKEA